MFTCFDKMLALFFFPALFVLCTGKNGKSNASGVGEWEKPPQGLIFKHYAPEKSQKSVRWSSGVITNCRNPKHLAFTFDDGIK